MDGKISVGSQVSELTRERAARMLMRRRHAKTMPPTYDVGADTWIPDHLWAPQETGKQRCLRRPLAAEERARLELRRGEIAPWLEPSHGPDEADRVVIAIAEMYSAFPHAAAKADLEAAARGDQLTRALSTYPCWAIEKCLSRIATRGYSRRESDGRYVQERHWAPSDPEIIEIIEAELTSFRRAHDSAAALLLAAVEAKTIG